MRVLVTWGSKLGGTKGIAGIIAGTLSDYGFNVVDMNANDVRSVDGFDAVIVGGALYANRWHRDARRFVTRHLRELRHLPVWFFSSGPLDDSAHRENVPPTRQVAVLMDRVGAQDHVTFGGRLEPDAPSQVARALARSRTGDWRNPTQIRAWATKLSRELPSARPHAAITLPARSLPRLLAHAITGWALCATLMAILLATTTADLAIALHAVATPVIFTAIALHYFRPRGARDPLPTAAAFAAITFLLDLAVIALLVHGNLAVFRSLAGTWLPLVLTFFATWATGALLTIIPRHEHPAPT